MGCFDLFCCLCGRRRNKPKNVSSNNKRIFLGKRRVTVKVAGGVLQLDGIDGQLQRRLPTVADPASPLSMRGDALSEDGYESALSELQYPDGMSSPNGSALFDANGVLELDVLEPESPSSGCIPAKKQHKLYICTSRPRAGSSIKQHTGLDDGTATCAVERAAGPSFMVRSMHYMRTKVKEPSGMEVYRLLGADLYSFDFKIFHISQHVQLPKPPTLGMRAQALPPNQRLPPLLVINLQLPLYSPSLFGSNDGQGHSLVYYFALPEGWEPEMVENVAALELLQRFFHDGKEFDGQNTRDRLKLIPRIVNVEEWAVKGPLSGYEHRLLINYNDKPIMTRPQHRYFRGEHYFEIDVDVHNYAYIARKAFYGFINRLAPVVFENAFVVQGNRPEELPEVILAAARVYRVDFTRSRPFPAETLEERGLLQHRLTESLSNLHFGQVGGPAVAEPDALRTAGNPS